MDGSLAFASLTTGTQHTKGSSFLSDTMCVAQDPHPRLARVTRLTAGRHDSHRNTQAGLLG